MTYPTKAALPCIACGTQLERATGDYEYQPYEGTMFETRGHYGSTFWDDFEGEALWLTVCDACLTKHTDRLARQKQWRNVMAEGFVVGRAWVNHELVPYFDGESDHDPVDIEPEEIGVLTGFQIEWAKNWEELKKHALRKVEGDE